MSPSRNEHTIAVSCEISGRGYWSGAPVTVRIHPAPAGTGVRLVRADLPGKPACSATTENTRQADFRTNLGSGVACFQMVEHLMAALVALEIDNCSVEVDGEELPGLDGSSQPYVESLRHAGLIVQAATRPRLVLNRSVRVESEGAWLEAKPSPDGAAHYEYQLSYSDGTPIPPQDYRCRLSPRRFATDVAPARTFVTEKQADTLRAQGIASHVTHEDLLVFGERGVVGNRVRFTNECARHKTLDLIGDLGLVGIDLIASFVSYRGGHRLNALMAQELKKISERSKAGASDAKPHRFAA